MLPGAPTEKSTKQWNNSRIFSVKFRLHLNRQANPHSGLWITQWVPLPLNITMKRISWTEHWPMMSCTWIFVPQIRIQITICTSVWDTEIVSPLNPLIKNGFFFNSLKNFVFLFNQVSDVNTQMMISLISIGSFLLILIGFQFARQVSFVLQNTPSKYMARTLILCGIYTITGTAAFVSLVIYRAAVLCDSICHFAFLLCAYQFFTLVIDYYGGESEFMKHTNGLMVFNLQTPPCCCCLRFLLPSELTKWVYPMEFPLSCSDRSSKILLINFL